MQLFEVSRPNGFKDYLSCLGVLTEDVTLEMSYDGVKAVIMDPSHVAMVEMLLPRGFFDYYNVGELEKVSFNIPDMLKALGKITKDDMLRVEYNYVLKTNETKNDEGVVIATSQYKDEEKLVLNLISDIARKKVLPCLQSLDEEVPQPRIYFKSKTRIIAPAFKRIVNDLDGEHIAISTDYESITFSHEGDRYNETTTLDKDNDNILDHRVEEPTRTTYTKSYLEDILKAVVKVSEVITLEFSEDMPVKLDVEIPQGRLVYYVAPCIGV